MSVATKAAIAKREAAKRKPAPKPKAEKVSPPNLGDTEMPAG